MFSDKNIDNNFEYSEPNLIFYVITKPVELY